MEELTPQGLLRGIPGTTIQFRHPVWSPLESLRRRAEGQDLDYDLPSSKPGHTNRFVHTLSSPESFLFVELPDDVAANPIIFRVLSKGSTALLNIRKDLSREDFERMLSSEYPSLIDPASLDTPSLEELNEFKRIQSEVASSLAERTANA
ncbi:MAG TPA: hypothetical protein VLG37_05325 [Candidatus Saccharimonadales bacterium]|nr:hypothetical protein [Candidatus Saccharimonadales bacterium]